MATRRTEPSDDAPRRSEPAPGSGSSVARVAVTLTSVLLGAAGLVLGVPLLLAMPPLGALLVYLSAITICRMVTTARSATRTASKDVLLPWLLVLASASLLSLAWAAVRLARGDPADGELAAAAGFAVLPLWLVMLVGVPLPRWPAFLAAFRSPWRRS